MCIYGWLSSDRSYMPNFGNILAIPPIIVVMVIILVLDFKILALLPQLGLCVYNPGS